MMSLSYKKKNSLPLTLLESLICLSLGSLLFSLVFFPLQKKAKHNQAYQDLKHFAYKLSYMQKSLSPELQLTLRKENSSLFYLVGKEQGSLKMVIEEVRWNKSPFEELNLELPCHGTLSLFDQNKNCYLLHFDLFGIREKTSLLEEELHIYQEVSS